MSDSDTAEPIDQPEAQARRLRNGTIAAAVLGVLIVALIIAVPGLHGVGRVVSRMNPGWLAAAIVFEVLSCVGYILVFLGIFERVSARFGARVAMTEVAFGAAVSLGGAGSLVVGAWLLRDRDHDYGLGEIAERSAVLFLLTSAINAITLIAAGLLLGLGILPGPRNPLLTLIPAAIVIVTVGLFLGLPPLSDRIAMLRGTGKRAALARGTAQTIRDTRAALFSPDWRLVGAFGYLWFNIAVMWACFRATGYTPPLAVIVLAYQIGWLANVLPVPGSVGVLEGSFVGMFVLYGAKATPVAAVSVVYHAITLWIPLAWGTVSFIRLQRDRARPAARVRAKGER
ncbi:MAG: lysylphosphatidylglycerol synthase transmembrane domain-containing protein [Solirubrobacteraceae bacterium]